MPLRKIRDTFELIKFSHSIFALPFALGAMLIAARGLPPWRTIFLIVAAVVCARTAAMAFNRWADADIDAKNPRTRTRHLPQGILSPRFAMGLTVLSSAGFLLVSGLLGKLCLILAPFALFVLFFYSYTKRFTDFSQLFLGLSLGIAPIGAWIAVTNTIGLFPLMLGAAVTLWVAGFDILYATQDYEFDRNAKLHSLVVRWGIPQALQVARLLHGVSFVLMVLLGYLAELHWPYYAGIACMGGLFFYQHSLVKPTDLSRVNAAFFTANGLISFLFLLSVYFSF
ncbi:MAG: 4-hydroxybenzoate octaprenyltransferase [bacterium]